jgi:hypothetical protein
MMLEALDRWRTILFFGLQKLLFRSRGTVCEDLTSLEFSSVQSPAYAAKA